MDSCGHILGRAVTGGGGDLPSSLALVVSRATNRLGGAGYYHDVLGNLVQMPAPDSQDSLFMTYLDQGHIGTLTDAAGVIWKYYYDADGKRRIKVKTAGGAATESDGQGGVRLVADRSYYFYEGEDLICQQDVGGLVARIPGTDDIDESVYEPKFLLLDHLGSTRAELVFTDSGGTFVPVIQEYYDLMPYGEVIDPPSVQESMLFTGKPRDTESGLDIFGARYYTPNIMRWSSPDSPFEDNWLEDPQSWNLFVYVRHNPVNRFDPNGQVSFGEVVDGVADFATGVARGMVASATYGLAPHSAPKETDSNSSIAGQFVGSTVAGMAGTSAVGTGLGMTGVGSIGGVIASPSGIGAVAGGGLAATGAAVAATGTTVAVGSVVNIVHLMSAVKREPSSKIRKDWEEATGEPWPKDTKTGKNQDVSHKKPLADGGSNKIDNVEPKPHDDHMKDHMNAGDFKRWGARSTLKNQENKTN